MMRRWVRKLAVLLALAPLALSGCGRDDVSTGADGRARLGSDPPRARYLREYVFLGSERGEPLVVPLFFEAAHRSQQTERVARAWLAHGSTWDDFLDETWRSEGRAEVWRIVPHGPLRIAARGPLDPSALWFRQGQRRLRLELGSSLSGWLQGDDTRYRVLRGRLSRGEETVAGLVLEILQIVRYRADGSGPGPADWLFLSSGDSVGLVLAEFSPRGQGPTRGFGWTIRGEGSRGWETAEIAYTELRPLESARRDIPLRWGFSLPEAGVTGEIHALGFGTQLGAERAGRRAVEARYTVRGWMEDEGRRIPVLGAVLHSQR